MAWTVWEWCGCIGSGGGGRGLSLRPGCGCWVKPSPCRLVGRSGWGGCLGGWSTAGHRILVLPGFGVVCRTHRAMPVLVWVVAKSAKILGIVAGFGPPHVRAGARCARAGARTTRYITRFLQVSPDFFSVMTLAFSFCHLIIRLMSIMTIFLSIITILKKERIYSIYRVERGKNPHF